MLCHCNFPSFQLRRDLIKITFAKFMNYDGFDMLFLSFKFINCFKTLNYINPKFIKCFRMAFLCFTIKIGRMRITIFHFLLSCTLIFTILWGYLIFSVISSALKEEVTIFHSDKEVNELRIRL